MNENIETDLKNSKGDIAYTTAKAGLSLIPILGGVATELFSSIIAPPISKRRDEWLVRIANGLQELQNKLPEFDISLLSQNEIFITTVMHATQTAIKNHHVEKLEALKNAVLNSAVGIKLDENIQLIFLNYIDSLTPWHLRILQFFTNPIDWFKNNNKTVPNMSMGSPSHCLEDAFDDLRGNRNFYDLVVKDLFAQGLLGIESLHTTMSGSGAIASRTTEFGNQFIIYITEPRA